MTLVLPPNCGRALRDASPSRQKKILAVLENWPSNVGQPTSSYSEALHKAVGKMIKAWGGLWLNPDEGTRHLKIQCARGHTWCFMVFHLHRGQWCPTCYLDSLRGSIKTRPSSDGQGAIKLMQQFAGQHQGKCLSTSYQNNRTRLLWVCKEGHQWKMAPALVKKGKWCPVCALADKKKRFLKEIQDFAHERGGQCLSDQYVAHKVKMTFQCASGHVWQTTPTIIRSSKAWCPVCRYKVRQRSLADLQALAAEHGGQCLAEHYVSMNEKVRWQCAKGHCWEAAGCRVQLGTWCLQCVHDKLRSTIGEMQELARSRGGECLSTHYEKNNVKLLWKCKLGHTWWATPGHVKDGTWCPSCFYLSVSRHEKARRRYLPVKSVPS